MRTRTIWFNAIVLMFIKLKCRSLHNADYNYILQRNFLPNKLFETFNNMLFDNINSIIRCVTESQIKQSVRRHSILKIQKEQEFTKTDNFYYLRNQYAWNIQRTNSSKQRPRCLKYVVWHVYDTVWPNSAFVNSS